MMKDFNQLLKIAFSYDSNRRQTEVELINLLAQDPLKFSALTILICNQDVSINEIQVATIMNAAIKQIYQTHKYIQLTYKQAVLQLFTNKNVSQKCKFLLKSSLELILADDDQFNKEFHQSILNMLESKSTIITSMYSFKILYELLDFQHINSIQQQWFHDYIERISTILQTNTNIETDYKIYLEFFQVFEEFIAGLFQYDKQQFLLLQNIVLQSKKLNQLFLTIFTFQSQMKQIYGQIEDSLIIYVLKTYKHIISRMFLSRNKQQQLIFPFYQQFNQFLIFLLQSISTCKKELLVILVQIINIAVAQKEYYNIFQQCYQELLVENFLQELLFSKFQLELFVESPYDFICQELDFNLRKKYEHLQQEIFYFIEQICKYLDGALSFISSCSIMLYKFSINEILQRQLFTFSEQEIQFLYKLQQRPIFIKCDNLQRLQVSLIILLSISQFISLRIDIQQYLAFIIKSSFQVYLISNNELTQILFIKFVGENSIYLRPHYGRIIQNEILQSFLSSDWSISTLYQKLDSINKIIQNDNDLSQIEKNEYFQQMILKVTPQILVIEQLSFFHFILEWIETYCQPINIIQQISFNIVARIMNEQARNCQTKEIYINICWSILEKIINKYTNFDYILCVENCTSKIYQQFCSNNNLEFKDSIIQFLSLIIAKLQRVNENHMQILYKMEQILTEQKFQLHELFNLLNNLIYFGREFFLIEQYQNLYFSIAIQCLKSNKNECLDKCEAALLIQLGIQCLRQDITEQNLQNIFENAYLIVSQNNTNQILRSRIICIFIIAILTIKPLSEKILGDQIVNIQMMIQTSNYTSGYDTKLFIIYFSVAMIANPQLLLDQGANLVSMLSFQVEQLQSDKFDEQYKVDEESDEQCYEEDDDEEQKALNEQISNFRSGYVSMDEFVTFRQAFSQLKSLNPALIEQFKGSLHYFTLNKLNQMLQVIRAQYEQPRQIIKIGKRKI